MLDVWCPRCAGDLRRYPVVKGFAARCDACDGLLVDGTALRAISGEGVAARTMNRAQRSARTSIACSLCDEPMKASR